MSAPVDTSPPARLVLAWLWAVYGMVVAMVLVGGITRLTGSGLSMVEWRPLMGALPPLSDAEWQQVFAKYQLSPQFEQVNHWMGLDDFKRIFFWEYLHRLLGRLIGVVFIVPWLWLALRKKLRGALLWRTALAFVLGGLQGLLGWYMVKSGLVDQPAVSHFRLAAHLLLALVVAGWVLWLILDVARARRLADQPSAQAGVTPAASRLPWRLAWALVVLVSLQIVYGAFMAGLRAGHIFPTFPLMYGSLFPEVAYSLEPWWRNLLMSPHGIHAIHRTMGYVVLLAVAGTFVALRRHLHSAQQRLARWGLLAAAATAVTLGAVTVLLHVPVWSGVAHQAAGVLVLSLALALAHAYQPRTAEGRS